MTKFKWNFWAFLLFFAGSPGGIVASQNENFTLCWLLWFLWVFVLLLTFYLSCFLLSRWNGQPVWFDLCQWCSFLSLSLAPFLILCFKILSKPLFYFYCRNQFDEYEKHSFSVRFCFVSVFSTAKIFFLHTLIIHSFGTTE